MAVIWAAAAFIAAIACAGIAWRAWPLWRQAMAAQREASDLATANRPTARPAAGPNANAAARMLAIDLDARVFRVTEETSGSGIRLTALRYEASSGTVELGYELDGWPRVAEIDALLNARSPRVWELQSATATAESQAGTRVTAAWVSGDRRK